MCACDMLISKLNHQHLVGENSLRNHGVYSNSFGINEIDCCVFFSFHYLYSNGFVKMLLSAPAPGFEQTKKMLRYLLDNNYDNIIQSNKRLNSETLFSLGSDLCRRSHTLLTADYKLAVTCGRQRA